MTNYGISRPMLAATLNQNDLKDLPFPLGATFKLDGIRCEIDGEAKSRTFKPIPNLYIKNELETIFSFGKSDFFDGEILSGKTFQDCSSSVMRIKGTPDFKYYLFDYVSSKGTSESYRTRMENLAALPITDSRVIKLLPTIVNNVNELLEFEETSLASGYEGVILRSLDGPYKCGRATNKEGYLLKLKRFSDSEAEILDFEELMHNTNEKLVNELGLSKRATCQENLVSANTLGTLIVRDIHTKVVFRIGTGQGLDENLRLEIWNNKEAYRYRIIKYKFFLVGVKNLPRHPVMLGFRHPDDM